MTNGEDAYQRTLFETTEYNAQKRYRLQSNPDIVVKLDNPAELAVQVGNLMAKQDKVAGDLGMVMPFLFSQNLQLEQPTPLQQPQPDNTQPSFGE